MYSESKRVEYLDSIRGLAALFVLLSHTVSAFDWPANYYANLRFPFLSIMFDGKEAVCMFFVLSGYVLSKPYVASADDTVPRKIFLPSFYLRRFTRIWLPWFFVFVVSIFARAYFFGHPLTNPPISKWFNLFWQASLTVGDFFRQCAFMLHQSTRQLLSQDWSLGVELKGSLLIPLLLFLVRGKRIVVLLGLAAAFIVFLGTGHYYISFIIGVLLARYGETLAARLCRTNWLVKLLFLLFGLLLYQASSLLLINFGDTRLVIQCGWIASSLGCGLVLLSSFSSKSVQKWLNLKPAVWLGRLSYSVYLVQFIIILCLLPRTVRLANGWGITNHLALFAMTLLVSVWATILCSILTYYFVEVPAINLGHKLTKRIQARFQSNRPCGQRMTSG